MNRRYGKEAKQAVICVALSVLMAAAAYMFNSSEILTGSGYEIKRDGYGESGRSYELLVDAEGVDEAIELPFELKVNHREYSDEEADRLICELAEELPSIICGDNEDLKHIKTDIHMPSGLPDYPGVRLRWYAEDSELIGYGGRINNKALENAVDTVLKLTVSAGDIKREYIFELRVLPAELSDGERLMLLLNAEIERLQEEQKYSETFSLPKEIEGIKLRYSGRRDNSPFLILVLGLAAAGLILVRPREQQRKEKKQRERELMIDYSDMVSKLLVYIGAGLTLRNAWIRIVEVYAEGIKKGREKRVCYEEMSVAADRIRQGIPEIKAYREFARACGLRPYLRLCTILEQNLKNGDRMLKMALEMEMREAFNERKNTAKRIGEEMSTKLLLPLFISMLGVVLIVSVPALMRLG